MAMLMMMDDTDDGCDDYDNDANDDADEGYATYYYDDNAAMRLKRDRR